MCPSDGETSTDNREYTVDGMTCAHCVMAVTNEVEQVAGVAGVAVDLRAGRVLVHGVGFSDRAVRDAVAEAGYVVTGS